MGAITVNKNTPYLVDLPSDFADGGWYVKGGIAYHRACNAGIIKRTGLKIESGKTYIVEFEVVERTSGGVAVRLGTAQGATVTASGKYTQEITANGTDLSFWSDGALGVSYVRGYEKLANPNNGITISFTDAGNKWTSDYSYEPEMMVRFNDELYSFKNGALWKHNVNPLRSNYYGEQFSSKITFFVNINPTAYKWFSRIRLVSDKAWSVPEVRIPKVEGKAEEMFSRIKEGNFKKLNGQWFAHFLRNMNDPRFDDAITALFKGNELKGEIMEITIEYNHSSEVALFTVDVETDLQNFTY